VQSIVRWLIGVMLAVFNSVDAIHSTPPRCIQWIEALDQYRFE
jgi:hypothetical protein